MYELDQIIFNPLSTTVLLWGSAANLALFATAVLLVLRPIRLPRRMTARTGAAGAR